MFDRKESEGTKRRHQVDTVVEGMFVTFRYITYRTIIDNTCSGINRLTHNIELALPIVDDAFRYETTSNLFCFVHLDQKGSFPA